MMRNTIIRTMATSEIHAFRLVMVDGVPQVEELPVFTANGKLTHKDAERALRREYGKTAPITIKEVKVSENTYEISVEDFLKYAKKVEKTEETNN